MSENDPVIRVDVEINPLFRFICYFENGSWVCGNCFRGNFPYEPEHGEGCTSCGAKVVMVMYKSQFALAPLRTSIFN